MVFGVLGTFVRVIWSPISVSFVLITADRCSDRT